ncbi:MAG: hypothetical protein LBH62_01965 [Nitrososphaerota archaeon]|nr:hypothetical protein [Nitrososphaerota archaeon]
MLGYHTQKLLAETQHDKDRLNELLQQVNQLPETVRDRLKQEQVDRRLNIITDEDFQKVIEKLPPEHIKSLTRMRKIKEKEKNDALIRTKEKERTLSHGRTR